MFRSPGLLGFLRLLAAAHPGWVDVATLRAELPGTAPRQLARYVDTLEAAGLALVRYETKTRGRYRLAVAPSALFLPNEAAIDVPMQRPAAITCASRAELSTLCKADWISWFVALLHGHLAWSTGHLVGEHSALRHFEAAGLAAKPLPPWAASVVYVRQAHALARAGRSRDSASCLRRVDTLARQGFAHPAAAMRACLVRAKLRYDQARYGEAQEILEEAPPTDGMRCPHYLNMQALLAGRRLISAGTSAASSLLTQALALLLEAIGGVMLGQGDTSLLDALTYNIGNNLWRGVQRKLLPETMADTAMQWLAVNLLVCRKLGIGEDTVLGYLLLVDIGLDHGYSVALWSPLLRYGVAENLDDLLARTTAHARTVGNRLEIAQCLRRHVRLARSPSAAKAAYREAATLFAEFGRADALRQLANEWRKRFNTTPPK